MMVPWNSDTSVPCGVLRPVVYALFPWGRSAVEERNGQLIDAAQSKMSDTYQIAEILMYV